MTAIKLSELRSKRQAMTAGEWRERALIDLHPHGAIKVFINGHWQRVAQASAEAVAAEDPSDPSMRYLANAAGIVATHNAADALIEIAEAALAWQSATARRYEVTALMQGATSSDDYSAACALMPAAQHEEMAARERVMAALDKVQP